MSEYLLAKVLKNSQKAPELIEMKTPSPSPAKRLYAKELEVEDYSPGAQFWSQSLNKDIPTTPTKVLPKSPVKSYKMERESELGNPKQLNALSVADLLRKIKSPHIPGLDIEFASQSTVFIDDTVPTKTEDIDQISNILAQHTIEIKALLKAELQSLVTDSSIALLSSIQTQIADLQASHSRNTKAEISAPVPMNAANCVHDVCNVQTILSEIKGEISRKVDAAPLDRATKSTISSINEKIIHLSKNQEHEFSNQNQRLSLIEKKLGKPQQAIIEQGESLSTLKSMVTALEARISRSDRERNSDMEKLEKLLKLSLREGRELNSRRFTDPSESDDDRDSKFDDLKKSLRLDQELNQDRMNQLMSMITILQEAHLELLGQLKKT